MDIKKGINIAASKFIEHLEDLSSPIRTRDDLYNLAMITTNNERNISDIITNVLQEVGISGLINIEPSYNGFNNLIISEGMRITNGYALEDFLDTPTSKEITLKKPFCLVVNDKIKSIEYLIHPLEYCKEQNRPLIIFSEGISKEPMSMLIYNKKKAGFDCCPVNIPDYTDGSSNLVYLEDICTMTGARLMNLVELKNKHFDYNVLGSAKEAIIMEYETVLVGVGGEKNAIKKRLFDLKYQAKIETDKSYVQNLKQRISRLEGKSAIIGVGGFTDVEVEENRDKIIDALNSCKSGLEGGILPGGGTAFIHSLPHLKHLKLSNVDLNAGVNAFSMAIKNILRILFKNTKHHPDAMIDRIYSSGLHGNKLFGYDINKEEYSENMINSGIIDSLNTVRTSIEDAVSIASLIITTEVLVYKEVSYEPPPLEFFKNKFKTDTKFREESMKKYENLVSEKEYKEGSEFAEEMSKVI